jgi:trimeric autotransporter adhesin
VRTTQLSGRRHSKTTPPATNTANGYNALFSNTTGTENTATGRGTLVINTTGNFNTANGALALYNNTEGEGNTAIGDRALFSNTTGSFNTATGNDALGFNNGNDNTAIGWQTLFSNTTGNLNTAIGFIALFSNTTGSRDTANGNGALASNTEGDSNTAVGDRALLINTTGASNTATGASALFHNTTGANNTAVGVNALLQNTTGAANIALGVNAGSSLTTGNGNIDIGNVGNGAEANTIRIGEQGLQTATFIAGISGATVTGTAVVVDGSGQLGVAPSSARFKEAIKSMDNASEALFSLEPVTFRYKKEIDPKSTAQFGLVAEDVEKVNADLVVRDAEGKVYTVRYDAVNAMLLNEFLKEHSKVENLKNDFQATVAQQQKEIAALAATLKEQASQIQKVSAQLATASPSRGGLEAGKFATGRIRRGGPAPQLVNNP